MKIMNEIRRLVEKYRESYIHITTDMPQSHPPPGGDVGEVPRRGERHRSPWTLSQTSLVTIYVGLIASTVKSSDEKIREPATMMPMFIFATGIENSYPTIDLGRVRVDEMEKCGHYKYWQQDFDLVQELGIRFLRYGPPIHRTWLGPGRYDWEFADLTFYD